MAGMKRILVVDDEKGFTDMMKMNLEDTGKANALAQLAALLATAAANAQCSQAVWLAGEGFQRLPNDALTPSAWDRLEFSGKRTPEQALEILARTAPGGPPARIGRVLGGSAGEVTLRSVIGAERIVDRLSGEQLPRIC